MIVKFERWSPDRAPFDTGSTSVLNVIHTVGGYEVMPSPDLIEPQGFGGGIPRKLFVGRSSDGIIYPIALGSQYGMRATPQGWVILGGSGLPADSWEVVPWGDAVYAVNGVDPLVKINILEGGNFEIIPTPNGLTGRYMASVAEFLMLADIREFAGNTRYPYRAQWSGIQRPEQFTPNAITQADYQDVADIGQFRGLTGGEFGLLLGEDGFARCDYVGPDVIFKFTTIETNVGCAIPESVIRTDNRTYWWSTRGWRTSAGEASQAIGLGQVDDWFRRTYHKDFTDRMSVEVLPENTIIMWSFVSNFSVDQEPDYLLAYNWETKFWTMGQFTVQILGFSATSSFSTDDLTLPIPGYVYGVSTTDDFTQDTDSFQAGGQFFAAMVKNQLAIMSQNSNVTAELEIKETQFNPSGLAILNKMLPVVHSAQEVTLKVMGRDTQAKEMYRIRDNLKPEPSGLYSCRMKARYHRIKVMLKGPFKKGLGIDFIDIQQAGVK